MIVNNYSRAYKDIFYILMSLEEKYKNKIPKELIKFFKENADNQYVPTIDLSKPLIDQKISKETELDRTFIENLQKVREKMGSGTDG